MKTFKCITDVEQFRSHRLHSTVESLVVPVLKFYADSGHPYRPDVSFHPNGATRFRLNGATLKC